jgi:hypothetical protein
VNSKIVIGLAAAGLLAADCGSSGTNHHAAAKPKLAELSCSTTFSNGDTASGDVGSLVADQNAQNKTLTQNWVNIVNGNPTQLGNNLQAVANDFAPYVRQGTSALAIVAKSFVNDANTFMTNEDGGLMPGWNSTYNAIAKDIGQMANVCGLAPPTSDQ